MGFALCKDEKFLGVFGDDKEPHEAVRDTSKSLGMTADEICGQWLVYYLPYWISVPSGIKTERELIGLDGMDDGPWPHLLPLNGQESWLQ